MVVIFLMRKLHAALNITVRIEEDSFGLRGGKKELKYVLPIIIILTVIFKAACNFLIKNITTIEFRK